MNKKEVEEEMSEKGLLNELFIYVAYKLAKLSE